MLYFKKKKEKSQSNKILYDCRATTISRKIITEVEKDSDGRLARIHKMSREGKRVSTH